MIADSDGGQSHAQSLQQMPRVKSQENNHPRSQELAKEGCTNAELNEWQARGRQLWYGGIDLPPLSSYILMDGCFPQNRPLRLSPINVISNSHFF